ncbi:MAG: 3-dehydroquinate synthase [Chloroflexi bacterium]|nr:3-dehydroquinate synthase [Chloroflexota bacterium]
MQRRISQRNHQGQGVVSTRRIFLTGFSGTGKSQVGRELARRLGWAFVDTDELVVALAGKPIPDIFAQEGEPRFREWERQALQQALRQEPAVIATGGGMVLDPSNREVMEHGGFVVCLEARPETILQRLKADLEDSDSPALRPLLAVPDPLERICSLKARRQALYALADLTVHTDNLTVSQVAAEVERAWRRASPPQASDAATVIPSALGAYPVYIGWGLLPTLGQRMKEAGLRGTAYVVSEGNVYAHHGPAAQAALAEADFEVHTLLVTPGEATKTLDTARQLYQRLIDLRAERVQAIVALGGGMIGDLAGFVAATFLRGLPLVQVPTSLLAMVDASLGGKVAVDVPQAKNLIGAFYPPRLVLADVSTLMTLPRRELVSGFAEVIKHALIQDTDMLPLLEEKAQALLSLDRELTPAVVRRSAAVKARIVAEDEREEGIRIFLNFGHTIGHGLEAASAYGLLHGEAVAVGMVGATRISSYLGLLDREAVERVQRLLAAYGLPASCPGVEADAVLQAMHLDKKVRGKSIRWVLLQGLGKPVVRDDVPRELVAEVVSLLAGQEG